MIEYSITVTWDDEARVWIAESNDEDIKGLILENGSIDALIVQSKIATVELLELGGLPHTNVQLRFKMERLALVA